MILAIDTTHEFGSIALAHDGAVLEEVPLHSPDGFGHILFDQLQRLLDRRRLALHEIDRFAAASGPGSFTGVRVGLACVKGLAEATARPVVGVSNLRALAAYGTHPLRAVLLDARRGEIYGAVYDAEGRLVQPETVAPAPIWLQNLPHGVEFISTDFTPFPGLANATIAPRALAGAIARIAETLPPQDPAALEANYVRRSDAELFWKDGTV